jgi:hypothetical protein
MAQPPPPESPSGAPPPGHGPLGAPGLPPGAPGRPSRNPLIIVLAAALALVVLVSGAVVTGFVLLRDGDDAGSAGPVNLRSPLLFQQVAQIQRPPCASGTLKEADGTACYRLEPGGMTVRRLEYLRVLPAGPRSPGWGISLRLTPTDRALFGDLSGRAHTAGAGNPGNQIAMVADGVVLAAPSITAPITGGDAEITGKFTQQQVTRIVEQLTGRPAS